MEAIKKLQNLIRRFVVRLGMLGTVVIVGGLAIAQMQRDGAQRNSGDAPPSAEVELSQNAGEEPSSSWSAELAPIATRSDGHGDQGALDGYANSASARISDGTSAYGDSASSGTDELERPLGAAEWASMASNAAATPAGYEVPADDDPSSEPASLGTPQSPGLAEFSSNGNPFRSGRLAAGQSGSGDSDSDAPPLLPLPSNPAADSAQATLSDEGWPPSTGGGQAPAAAGEGSSQASSDGTGASASNAYAAEHESGAAEEDGFAGWPGRVPSAISSSDGGSGDASPWASELDETAEGAEAPSGSADNAFPEGSFSAQANGVGSEPTGSANAAGSHASPPPLGPSPDQSAGTTSAGTGTTQPWPSPNSPSARAGAAAAGHSPLDANNSPSAAQSTSPYGPNPTSPYAVDPSAAASSDSLDPGAGSFGGLQDPPPTLIDDPGASPQLPGDTDGGGLDSAAVGASDPATRPDLGSGPLGTGRPGPPELEGPQTPTVTIQKLAPDEIRFGQPALIEIKVRNVGLVPANAVVVQDEVPEGAQLVQTNPQAEVSPNGILRWEVGTIRPGEEVTLTEEILATREGTIGSVATVGFEAAAASRSRATRPMLELKHTGPRTVLVGQPVKFSIELTNPGSGAATKVMILEDVPDGLQHAAGKALEYEVGTILPGTTRRLELTLTAAKPGPVENVLIARADGGIEVEDRIQLEVVAPELQVALEGPVRRYLERRATYELTIANPGTADATNVELICHLPESIQFVSTNNSGLYNPATRTIRWSLARLPAREMGKVQFTVTPMQMGEFALRAEARGDRGLTASTDHQVQVEGLAALYFGVADMTDPIEAGGQTRYEIRVVNQGSKAASNVRVVALVPSGMKPLDGEGQTAATIQGQQVMFEPLAQLPPKSEAKFYVTVEGLTAGDHRFAVQLTSDDISQPVKKEESTSVYSDQ